MNMYRLTKTDRCVNDDINLRRLYFSWHIMVYERANEIKQSFSVWDTYLCIKLRSGLTVTSMKDLIMAYPQANSQQQVWISWSSMMTLITDVTCHMTYSTLKNTHCYLTWSSIGLTWRPFTVNGDIHEWKILEKD